jgi:hypothetical protein
MGAARRPGRRLPAGGAVWLERPGLHPHQRAHPRARASLPDQSLWPDVDEITASSLVKVDQACNKLIDSPFPVNPAGFTIHSCIHQVREDAGCVLHTHSRAGVAVSAQKCGVLPISQQSTFVLASLAYHDYEGVALRDDERPRLQADMGDRNFLMLRNHGLLTVGKTIADAFLSACTPSRTPAASRSTPRPVAS